MTDALATIGAALFVVGTSIGTVLATGAVALWVAGQFERLTGRNASDLGFLVFVLAWCVELAALGGTLWWFA